MRLHEYANELFNTIGIGDKERNDGALLVISSGDSRVRLEIGVGLEDVLTDSLSSRILDDYFVPYRADCNYDSAVILTASAVANTIAADHDVTLSNTYNTNISADTESESHPATKSDIALIVLFFVAFIVISLFPFITIIFIAVMIFRSAKNQNTDSSQNPIIESSRNGKVFIRLGNSVTDISNDDSYAIRTRVQIMNSEAFIALEAVLVVLADLGIKVLTHPVLPILPVQAAVEDVLEVEELPDKLGFQSFSFFHTKYERRYFYVYKESFILYTCLFVFTVLIYAL